MENKDLQEIIDVIVRALLKMEKKINKQVEK